MLYKELLTEILKNGKESAPRGILTKELRNVTLKIIIEKEKVPNFIAFKNSRPLEKILNYELSELAWYFSTDRNAEIISKSASLWGKIKNKDNSANSNYGYLVFKQKSTHPSLKMLFTMSGFQWAEHILKQDQNSREAVITYNNGSYNYQSNKDYICTQCQMFLIRDNKLHCTVPLRSSDAIFGLTFNMPWWSIVHQLLRIKLLESYPNLSLGDIIVNIQSAHLYEQHFQLAEKMINDIQEEYFIEVKKEIPIGNKFEWYNEHLLNFIKINKLNDK